MSASPPRARNQSDATRGDTHRGDTHRGDALNVRLSAEQGSLRARSTAMLALAAVAILVAVAAIGVLLLGEGRWMILSRIVPFVVWIGAIALAAYVVRRLRTRDADVLSLQALAGAIEREQSLRSGSLRGALEVADRGVLGARAAQDVADRLSHKSLAPRLTLQLHKSLTYAGVAAVGGAVLLAVSAQQRADGFSAMVHPIRAFRGTLLPALGFEKLPVSVPRGMPLTVRLVAPGRHTITVSRRAAGESWSDTTLIVDADNGTTQLSLGPIRTPVTLRVTDGRSPETQAVIAVDDRGWIGDVALYAQYPAYLGRTNETLDAVSPIRVPRGTRVRVTAVMQGGVTTAALHSVTGELAMSVANGTQPSGVEGTRVSTEFTVDRDGAYGWSASAPPRATGESLPPELPDSLAFIVTADLPPEILIAAPISDTAIGVVGEVPVIIRAGDDHAVANVSLVIWREPADRSDTTAIKREHVDLVNPDAPFFEGGVTLPLDGLKLAAGDRVHIIATAIDNSPWRQHTSSREVILRVPTVSEQRALARSLADSLVNRAQQMAAEEKRLQQNTADASRSRELQNSGKEESGGSKADGNKGAMSFQAAEKARELARQQQQMMAKIDSLRQSTKDLENKLKSASALDTALANRMRDIQKMLRDAVTPEMQKQLEALNKNADQLSATEAQQNMQQLAQQQQQLRQQLDKSAEMLKRAALEGAMSTLSDEASELADAQRTLAGEQPQKSTGTPKTGEKSNDSKGTPQNDPNGKQTDTERAAEQKSLADRARALQDEVEKLTQRLQDAGAKPGASRTEAAEPMVKQAADAMDRAANEALKTARAQAQRNEQAAKNQPQQGDSSAMQKALQSLKDEKAKNAPAGEAKANEDKSQANSSQQSGQKGQPKPGSEGKGEQGQGQQSGGQQQGSQSQQQQAGQKGQQGQQGGRGGGSDASQAGDAMDKAAKQLADAREAQIDAWKTELSEQLDKSISETAQLARQQADLEQRAKQSGNAQGMQGEQGAVQQGVKQAAERLEQAARSSSLLSQRSQKAMADAQRKVGQSTQSMGQAGQPGGSEQAQNAMKDATEALNQALSSLVRDREKVNNAESASGFTEMMEQLKQLAQQQGALNGQMQGLNLLPGGAKGEAAQQQARVLARQQRDVAQTLTDVSDADQTGRTDALAKEAQMLAQQMERVGLDATVAARQQQLYRRLLDAGRFLEQDERDDQGAREAKAGSGLGGRTPILGAQSGKAANKYDPPTWNELRGLGPEERRLVIEYFRKLNGSPP